MESLQAVSLFFIFILAKQVTIDFILNELGIISIGIGVALIANLYMPSLDHKIEEYRYKN